MSSKRLTKQDLRNQAGNLNPVGHIVLSFKDDAVTAEAAAALKEGGCTEEDVLAYTAAEATPRLRERVQTASEGAGFGYEITLMRRYLALGEGGAGWLVVYAPDDAASERIVEVAKRFGPLSGVRYHRLVTEDLI